MKMASAGHTITEEQLRIARITGKIIGDIVANRIEEQGEMIADGIQKQFQPLNDLLAKLIPKYEPQNMILPDTDYW